MDALNFQVIGLVIAMIAGFATVVSCYCTVKTYLERKRRASLE